MLSRKRGTYSTKTRTLILGIHMYFCHILKRPKLSSTSTICFEEDTNITKRKPIGDLTTKALRNRLYSLKSHLDNVAQNEGVSPRLLILIAYYLAPMRSSTLVVLRFAKR